MFEQDQEAVNNRLVHHISSDTSPDGIVRSACFSPCRVYRYSLTRAWGEGESVLFIGLNPSTADHQTDDPTVRRCIGFAQRWGYSQLTLVNLFAFRSTDPKRLRTVDDPVGPLNEEIVRELATEAGLVVAAWGNIGHAAEQEWDVSTLFPEIHCLDTTKNGSPRHPLYVPANAEPILYRG